ncbi:hypothetical protein ACSDR0_24985 [Streptosporangium sp. G11]|uniref:hypothetical protein n=1 Tax=Streptosporangium sp. G11 TaxID=3436926 RepID=UPI003EB8AE7F
MRADDPEIAGSWTSDTAVFEGDPRATGKDRRPLRKIFEGLAAGDTPISLLVLLGTTNPGAPGGGTFADHADTMRRLLTSEAGMCGARFEPGAVSVVRLGDPALRDAAGAMSRWLAEHHPDDILISCGSGAFALSVGALCAALETRRPTRIVHLDTPDRPYSLDRPRDMDAHLAAWLLRYRFWDGLAEVDPANQMLWELLAARQAGNLEVAARLRDRSRTAEISGLTPGKADWFTKEWPTVQAALFERIGRGEAADYGLLRAWFAEQLRRSFERDQDKKVLTARTEREIGRLVAAFGDRAGGAGRLSALVRAAARTVEMGGDAACVQMIRDDALTGLYTAASTHRAHLMPERLEPGPLPQTLLRAADRWEKDDPGFQLVAATGRTGWPVLGSGDVLGLLAVGLDREGRDVEDQTALETVLAGLRERRGLLSRRGILRLRLLASEETRERAHRLARWAAETSGESVDARVIEGVSGDLRSIHDVVVTALRAEAPPTGRTGSGSPRDVDEVVLVLNPGPPMTNYGMIAAGVEWSLTAACPLWVTELVRVPGAAPQLRTGRPVAARLGADRVLAGLAMSAVRRLDLRTGRRLVERGSGLLRAALPGLAALEMELFGPAPDDWTMKERCSAAKRRLLLVAEACGEHRELAAYLAVEAIRPALFTWRIWTELRAGHPALDALAKLANSALQGHALDQRDRGGRRQVGGDRGDVRKLVRGAADELDGTRRSDDELIKHYKSVINGLSRAYRESG